MPHELRGTRYLTKDNEDLKDKIVNDLHYMDFGETMKWYEDILGKRRLLPIDKALLGCNDRFFLLTNLCHRTDALHPWLFARCREVEDDPDGHLDLWARYHYKSSIGSFAGIIQEVLCDPEITVAIISCTNEVARPFLTQIQQELENNQDLKDAYPDVLWQDPRKEAPLWSRDKGIVVKRKSNPKEATIEAFGVIDGMRTGKHYRLLDYDDLVTEKLVTSPEMIQKVTERWELSDNLGSHHGTRKWHWGTRYSFADSYGVILARGTLKERRYAATADGTLKGKPVFLSEKRWEEVKDAQRSTVNAQMLLNPLAGNEQVFLAEFFRSYEVIPAAMNIYILVDPSKGKSNRSDRTAMAVIGIDTAGNKYLLDGVRHRMKLSQRWQMLKQLYQYWSVFPGVQSIRVGYEVYGMQTDDEVIKEKMLSENVTFELIELNWSRDGKNSKKDRVERLEPDMRKGRFYLPSVVWHPDFGGRDNSALWKPWTKVDQEKANAANTGETHDIGTIIYRPMIDLTKAQKVCEVTGQQFRIVKPIKRLDEDKNVYDLTRAFIEEALFFPYAPHEDLIDAASRIYDEQMEAMPAQKFEAGSLETVAHPDA